MEHTIVIGLCKTLHIRSFYELNKHTSFPTIEGLLAKKTIRGNRKQNSHYLLYFLESCKYWISDINVYRKTKYVRCCIEFNDMIWYNKWININKQMVCQIFMLFTFTKLKCNVSHVSYFYASSHCILLNTS